MGGPGSGRPRTRPLIARVSREERRQRRYQIAVYAAQHGVRAAMIEFNASENLVRRSLWGNKLYPARELRKKIGVSAIGILKRMLIDRETADEAAAVVGVTVTYARAVRQAAKAAGFTFEEAADDSRHGVNAAEPDSGERGESPVVG